MRGIGQLKYEEGLLKGFGRKGSTERKLIEAKFSLFFPL